MHLLDWQYLLFFLPVAFAAMYLLLTAIGMFGGGADADVSADNGVDVAHGDIGVEHADVAHGELAHGDTAHGDLGHADAGHGGIGHDIHPNILDALLGFLGVGKAPMSILMMSGCFVWGSVGVAGVTVFGEAGVWKAAGLAAASSILITRYLAIGLAKFIPSVESYHTPMAALEGLSGEVLYAITEESGTVRVRDPQQNIRDVPCRIAPGEKTIPAGSKVVLFYYDKARGTFSVSR